MKKGRAKSLVMQRQYRSQVAQDKTKYRRKSKHKKPRTWGFFVRYLRIFICDHQFQLAYCQTGF